MTDTLAQITRIIREELESARRRWACPDLDDATSFERDLRCTAIDMFCIAREVETQMHVVLPVEGLDLCHCVGDVVRLVERVRGRVEA